MDAQREALKTAFNNALNQVYSEPNAGLLWAYGLADQSDEPEKVKANFFSQMAKLKCNAAYKQAFNRWVLTTQDAEHFGRWVGKLDGRLFIGTGAEHVLETNLSLSRPYGMPYIPGSALKGITRAYVESDHADKQLRNLSRILFGLIDDSDPNLCEAGYIIFHDAWWFPAEDKSVTPFVQDIVTPHHQEYYARKAAATDFDSPIPCAQLATRGNFLFCVEAADQQWAALAMKVLRHALENYGVGSKTSAGYGFFSEYPNWENILNEIAEKAKPENNKWINVLVKRNPGNGELTAQQDGKRAIARGKLADTLFNTLSEENRNNLKRNRELYLTIEVKKQGNSYSIEKLTAD